jgi:hypothetical protein
MLAFNGFDLLQATSLHKCETSVAPIKGIQMGVRVFVLEGKLVPTCDAESNGIGHFGLFIFEAIGQDDPCPVLFARHRVLNRLGMAFEKTRNLHSSRPSIAIHFDENGRKDWFWPIGANRREDFKERTTHGAAPKHNQCLALFRRALLINNYLYNAIALMDWSRPPGNPGDPCAVKPRITKVTLSDLPDSRTLTMAVGWERIELTWTSPRAIAICNLLARYMPLRFSWCAHVFPLSFL